MRVFRVRACMRRRQPLPAICNHSCTIAAHAPFASQSDTCGAGRRRAQIQAIGYAGTMIHILSSWSSINVSSWNPGEQNVGSCDSHATDCSFALGTRPKGFIAVRLGVRGAMGCAGQLGWARACVQRGRRPVAPLTIPLRRVFSGANQTSPEASRRGAPPAQCRSPHPEPQGRS